MTTATPLATDDVWHTRRKAEPGLSIRSPDRFGAQQQHTGRPSQQSAGRGRSRPSTPTSTAATPAFDDRLNNVAYDLHCKGLITLGSHVAPTPEALKVTNSCPITHEAHTNDKLTRVDTHAGNANTSKTLEGLSATFRVQGLVVFSFSFFELNCCTISCSISDRKNMLWAVSGGTLWSPLCFSFFFFFDFVLLFF